MDGPHQPGKAGPNGWWRKAAAAATQLKAGVLLTPLVVFSLFFLFLRPVLENRGNDMHCMEEPPPLGGAHGATGTKYPVSPGADWTPVH